MQVYVDESERRDYLLCAVLVRTDVGPVRRAVRAMCRPGQRRVHFAKEGPARRRTVLSALAELGVQARIYRSPSGVKRSRELCLDALVDDIAAAGAERLVIESRATMDHLDDRVIKAALRRIGTGELTFGHAGAHEEPLLWMPDAIAWAVGRAVTGAVGSSHCSTRSSTSAPDSAKPGCSPSGEEPGSLRRVL
ncbi:MAG TPA: hypothetical protein VGL02_22075 [Streptomyces sp.]